MAQLFRLPLPFTGIFFDAASNSGYKTAASTYNWSHTCAGDSRYLVVGIAMLSVLGSSVTSITYNSVAMTLIGTQASAVGAIRVELWGLVAPATGSNTISVTLSAPLDSAGAASSWTGVNQTVPYEAFNSATATNVGAADATVNVTTVASNDWCVDIVATDDTVITVGAGQTSRANVTGTLGSGAMSSEGPKSPAGAVTMSWTGVDALKTWSIASTALRPVTALGTATLTANQGSYSLTGQTNLFQMQEVASQGSFTETGQASVFQLQEVAAQGSYAETGQATVFQIQEVASQGSFGETGQTTIFQLAMVSGQGSFTLSGQDAALQVVTRLVADVGLFSETGQASVFQFQQPTTQGSFTVADGGTVFQTQLPALHATYTHSGQVSVFQFQLLAVTGSFNLNGQTKTYQLQFPASHGIFSETGEAALFVTELLSGTGTFTLVGKDVTDLNSLGVTLDPLHTDDNAILSNGNLTATAAPGFDTSSSRTTTSKETGKWYAEFHIDAVGSQNGVGLMDDTMDVGVYMGFDEHGIAYYKDSSVQFNAGNIDFLNTFTAGDIVSLATNIDTQEIWWRVNGGDWNHGGTDDPATGLGGISYLGIGSPLYLGVYVESPPDAITCNFGATPFTYTIPSGFLPWDNSAFSTASSEFLIHARRRGRR